jgi:hypothetical protein
VADKYWFGGSGTWGTAATNWSLTSGGTTTVAAPGSTDRAIIDNNSAGAGVTLTVTRIATASIAGFSVTRTNGPTIIAGTSAWTILTSGIDTSAATSFSWTNTGAINVNATCTLKGSASGSGINVNTAGITVTPDGFTSASFTLSQGTVSPGAGGLTCSSFGTSGASAKVLSAGSGTITVNAATTTLNLTSASLTISGVPTFVVNVGASSFTVTAKTAISGSPINLTISNPSTWPATISGSFNNLDATGILGTIDIGVSSFTGNFLLSPTIGTLYSNTALLTFLGAGDKNFDQGINPLNRPITVRAGTVVQQRAFTYSDVLTVWGAGTWNQNGFSANFTNSGGVIGDATNGYGLWYSGGGALTVAGSKFDLQFQDATTITMTSSSAKGLRDPSSNPNYYATIIQGGAGTLTIGAVTSMYIFDIKNTTNNTTVSLPLGNANFQFFSLTNTTITSSVAPIRAGIVLADKNYISYNNTFSYIDATNSGTPIRAPSNYGNVNGGSNVYINFSAYYPSQFFPLLMT